MVKQVITIILKRNENIERVRIKYHPGHETFEPHITLVYPFEVENQKKLKEHINESLKDIKPFKIRLRGLKKSTRGHYIYLLVDKGKEKIIELYEKLNTGILKDFKNPDMKKYEPHLSLAVFHSEEKREKAMKEISKINPVFETKIKSIQLLTIGNTGKIKEREDFCLG